MESDIRDKSYIGHDDIVGLNFIKNPGRYVYRKYHKQGLRSQIMEVLNPDDVAKQTKGITINGILHFPWAKPIKILRIFRTRFESVDHTFDEIKKLKIVEAYLPPDSYAKSHEFIVDYIRNGQRDFILCGLQDYVEGEALNPWDITSKEDIADLLIRMGIESARSSFEDITPYVQKVQKNADHFIRCVKKMILEAGYVPDFAGLENLILTPMGNIKLVDINNISRVSFGASIPLDDKGYPVSDKSIEAISMLEQKLMDRPLDKTEPLYRTFLDPDRMKDVKQLEETFHHSVKFMGHYPK
ncbi:MAG: hypothetical protein JSV38_08195 [Desulfobacterales bacterium]|nr:MAG: hypothetical protein JSV38_08195 [Desulfobacterales bacterium]